MTAAHITRLMTFAQHGQPRGYGGSDMMRADLEALILSHRKPPDEDIRTAFESWWEAEVKPILRPGINMKAVAYGAWMECDNRWLGLSPASSALASSDGPMAAEGTLASNERDGQDSTDGLSVTRNEGDERG